MLHFAGGTILPPHNLLLLAGMAKDIAELQFLDAVALRADESAVIEHVAGFNPDIIFVNTSTPTAEEDCSLGKKLKSRLGAHLVYMGPHAVYTAREIFEKTGAEYILINNTPEVVKALIERLSLSVYHSFPGVYCYNSGKIEGEPVSGYDIEHFPFPAWGYAALEKYFYLYTSEYPYATMLSSIGCLFRCKFCPYPVAVQSRFAAMSAERIISEMQFLKSLGVKMILFRDALFTAEKKRIYRMCELMLEQKIGLLWRCETSIDCVDEQLLQKMAQSGCRGINFGIESVVPEVAGQMNCESKRKDLSMTKKIFRACRSLGIETFAFFIHGLPNDTRETIKSNVRFAIELGPDHVQFSIVTPFPGTELYAIAQKENLLIEKTWHKFSSLEPVMATRFLSTSDIARLNKWAYRRFFIRPSRILKECRHPGRLLRRAITYLHWLKR